MERNSRISERSEFSSELFIIFELCQTVDFLRGYPQCAVFSSESDKTHYEMGFTSHEFLIHQPSTGLLRRWIPVRFSLGLFILFVNLHTILYNF